MNASSNVSAADIEGISFNEAGFRGSFKELGKQSRQFSYDLAGNRTQTVLDGVTTKYASLGNDSNRNQYTSVAEDKSLEEVSHTHDNNGHLTGLGSLRYQFDAYDRLVVIDASGQQVSYRYDALGRRISKQYENGLTTTTEKQHPTHSGSRFSRKKQHLCLVKKAFF